MGLKENCPSFVQNFLTNLEFNVRRGALYFNLVNQLEVGSHDIYLALHAITINDH